MRSSSIAILTASASQALVDWMEADVGSLKGFFGSGGMIPPVSGPAAEAAALYLAVCMFVAKKERVHTRLMVARMFNACKLLNDADVSSIEESKAVAAQVEQIIKGVPKEPN